MQLTRGFLEAMDVMGQVVGWGMEPVHLNQAVISLLQ